MKKFSKMFCIMIVVVLCFCTGIITAFAATYEPTGGTLVKDSGATIITSSTLINSEYTAVSKGAESVTISQPDESVSGVNTDNSRASYVLKAGKTYSARYNKVMLYNGEYVDIVFKIVGFEENDRYGDARWVSIYPNNPGVFAKGYSVINTTYTFYKAGTSTLVEPKGVACWNDVDVQQGVAFNKTDAGAQTYYVTSDCIIHKKTVGDKSYFFEADDEQVGSGRSADLQYTMKGTSSFEADYTFKAQAGLWLTFNKSIPSAIPTPTKRVMSGTTEATSNTLSTRSSDIVYKIHQIVPYETSSNYFDDYIISDSLPAPAIYKNFSVVDEDGVSRKSWFDVAKNGNTIELVANNVDKAAFYGHSYTFTINCSTTNYDFGISNKNFTFSNEAVAIAHRDSTGGEQRTNTVTTTLPITSFSIQKRNGTTNSTAAVANTSLEGAAFEVKNSSGIVVGTIITNASGVASISGIPADTYTIHEIAASRGFQLAGDVTINRTVGSTQTSVYINEPQRIGSVKMTKTDSVTGEKLAGAKYNVYEWNGTAYSTTVYATGTTGADGIATIGNLYADAKNGGKFKIVEVGVPTGYVLNATPKEFTVTTNGQVINLSQANDPLKVKVKVDKIDAETKNRLEGVTFDVFAFNTTTNAYNTTKYTTLTIQGDKTYLSNWLYYNKTNGGKFKLVETGTRNGYVGDYADAAKTTKNGYIITLTAANNNTTVTQGKPGTAATFANTRQKAKITLNKFDIESDLQEAQADATLLDGAVYGLYAREAIVHRDGVTGTLFAKDALVASGTLANGTYTFDNLEVGKYYVKEITAPTGYTLDTKEYDVDATSKEDKTETYTNTTKVTETVKKQAFQIIKVSSTGVAQEVPLVEKAGFKIYLLSDLAGANTGDLVPTDNTLGWQETTTDGKKWEDYDFTTQPTATYYPTYPTNHTAANIPELFTDNKGYLVSPELPYGTYVIVETTVPKNMFKVKPFIVKITEDNRTPKVWRVFDDVEFNAYLKINKVDSSTGKNVLKAGAKYRIYDTVNNKYIEQMQTYPTAIRFGTEDNPYVTNEKGYLITPKTLKPGTYRIEEVAAPEGYVRQGYEGELRDVYEGTGETKKWTATPSEAVTVEISTDNVYQYEEGTDEEVLTIAVNQSNDPQMGKVSLYKHGMQPTGVDKVAADAVNFSNAEVKYTDLPVKEAEFKIKAAEIIYTTDGQGTVLYEKDQVIETITTNEDGKAWTTTELPIGKYYIEETVAGYGMTLNTEKQEFEITPQEDTIAFEYEDSTYQNERQSVRISLHNRDKETDELITTGATYGLYASEDILDVNGDVLFAKGELIAQAVGDEEGYADFKEDLPHGKYNVKELHAPAGYYSNKDVWDIDASYTDQTKESLDFVGTMYNYITKLQINLYDNESKERLEGGTFQILDSKGNVVKELSMVREDSEIIKGLSLDETYTLVEKNAPNGYYYDIVFDTDLDGEIEVDDKTKLEEINKITYKIEDKIGVNTCNILNNPVKGKINISTTGDVPKATTTEDGVDISYDVKGLPNSTYEIWTTEAIKNPDGVSEDIYPAGTKIGTVITDENGNGVSPTLPLGKYTVKQVGVTEGYYNEPNTEQTVELAWKDSATPIVEKDVDFYLPKQTGDIGTNPDPSGTGGGDRDPELKGKAGITKLGVDGENETAVEGAVYGLYARTDIKDAFGTTVIPANTLIEKATTQADGLARFTQDLPVGKYYVIEEDAPTGYYGTDKVFEIDIEAQKTDDSIEIVRFATTYKNAITTTKIFLTDDVTSNELEGSTLKITDSTGKTFETIITTDTNGSGMVIKGLDPGETYTIEEVVPRYGYTYDILTDDDSITKIDMNHISFTVPKVDVDGDLTNIPDDIVINLKNAFVTGHITINKNGEVLDTHNFFNKVGNFFSDLFGSIFGADKNAMSNISFTIYAKEDIVHPDGTTGVLYKAGEPVMMHVRGDEIAAKLTTDENGKALFEGLHVGKYVIKEDAAADNHALADDVIFTIAPTTPDKADVAAVEGDANILNKLQRVHVEVTKLDKDTNKPVAGAKFGLYVSEDIKGSDGSVLVKKGTLLETTESRNDGVATFDSELINAKYCIVEMQAPAGYTNSHAEIAVDATWKAENQNKVLAFNATVHNEISKVDVSKLDAETGETIEGAELAVYDKDVLVKSWKTTKDAYRVQGLEIGKEYTLVEITPAPGYVTAKPVKFVVNDISAGGEYVPQTVEMIDQITRVSIHFVDKTTGENVTGVKCEIVDANGNVITSWISDGSSLDIDKLPIGNYQVVINGVPVGYINPGDTGITVKDTADLQDFVIPIDFTKVTVSTVDKETGSQISGIHMHLEDANGKVVASWVSGRDPEPFDKLAPGQYKLVVDSVPNGYKVPAPKTITILETGEVQNFKIELERAAVRKVKTGMFDGTNMGMFCAILALLLCGTTFMGVMLIKTHKKNRRYNRTRQ